VAIQAAVLLGITEKRHPNLLKPIAKSQILWPVLATDEPGWEKEAVCRIAELRLGAELGKPKVRFRQARGADANLPARRWAKAAVRTIEETHFRCLAFGPILREFGSTEAMADFCVETHWTYGQNPRWLDDVVRLGKFSTETLPQWKRAVRKMIREQLPEFHAGEEWATQRNSAEARGRNTVGEIQNAILDDITSALERIVPAREMPKSAC
jgi:hypothetical protein